MKLPSEATLAAICGERGIVRGALAFLGGGREDSDGVVYRFHSSSGERVLKVVSVEASEQRALEDLEARVRFANYLGLNGVSAACPLADAEGRLYSARRDGRLLYVAYEMALCPGSNPRNDELTPSVARAWGALTGKSHRLTRAYPLWKKFDGGKFEYGYLDEMSFFENWCRDDVVKAQWRALKAHFSSLPIDRAGYGFIHNDNHQRNILLDGANLTLIDFDCAMCNFLAHDIATPMQGLMFENCGGMTEPVKNAAALLAFRDAFLAGYESETHLDDFWLKNLELFVRYRRLLLFTCMQDFLATVPRLQSGMRDMIASSEPIFSI